MNENNDVAKWLKKIEETFTGPSGVIGERGLLLQQKEKYNYEYLITQFKGYVRLMDAFFDFIIDTLNNISINKETKDKEMLAFSTSLQIITFWRFRASYNIFWQGYFIDALSLLRSVLETTFQIAALEVNVIKLDDIFGNLRKNMFEEMSEEAIKRILNTNLSKTDKKVNDYLYGPASGLSPDAQDDIKSLIFILHNAVHKSRLNVALYYGPWARGEKHMPIFPEYDEDAATCYMNDSQFIGWMIVKSLFLLRDDSFPGDWMKKFTILDESFKFAIAGFKKRTGRSIEELILKKFTFTK